MANQLHEFTVQEAQNFSAYTSYEFEKQTMDGSAKEYTDWDAAALLVDRIKIDTTSGDNDIIGVLSFH